MEPNKNIVDADYVLAYAGDFGKYQFVLMTLFCVVNILSAFHYFGQTFISIQPENCDINYNLTKSETDNATIFTCSNDASNEMFGYISISQQVSTI